VEQYDIVDVPVVVPPVVPIENLIEWSTMKPTLRRIGALFAVALLVFGLNQGCQPSAAQAALTYLYAGAYQTHTTTLPTGIAANLSVHSPALTSGDFHTLAEIDVEKTVGGSQQIVEAGWTVDSVGGSPKIFVGRWVNGVFGGYNTGGWVDNAANATNAGATLSGSSTRFTINYGGSRLGWWIWQGTTAGVGDNLGYFPATEWTNAGVSTFTDASLTQAFGEVAANVASPCTDMGSGVLATSTTGASIGSITLTGLANSAVNFASTTITNSAWYNAVPVGTAGNYRTIRYGGPGAC